MWVSGLALVGDRPGGPGVNVLQGELRNVRCFTALRPGTRGTARGRSRRYAAVAGDRSGGANSIVSTKGQVF